MGANRAVNRQPVGDKQRPDLLFHERAQGRLNTQETAPGFRRAQHLIDELLLKLLPIPDKLGVFDNLLFGILFIVDGKLADDPARNRCRSVFSSSATVSSLPPNASAKGPVSPRLALVGTFLRMFRDMEIDRSLKPHLRSPALLVLAWNLVTCDCCSDIHCSAI